MSLWFKALNVNPTNVGSSPAAWYPHESLVARGRASMSHWWPEGGHPTNIAASHQKILTLYVDTSELQEGVNLPTPMDVRASKSVLLQRA